MDANTRIVIVGAGMAGASLAAELAPHAAHWDADGGRVGE